MTFKTAPTIIVDTREQTAWGFPPTWKTVRKALPTGDYTLLGHEHTFVIERKSLPDLAGCIFTDRFKAELKRLAEFRYAFLAIESTISGINLWSAQRFHRTDDPAENKRKRYAQANQMLGFLQSIHLIYGVHVLFLETREQAQIYCWGLLEKYNRYLTTDYASANERKA